MSEAYRRVMMRRIPPVKNNKELVEAVTNVLFEIAKEGATFAEVVAIAQLREAVKGRTQAAAEISDRIDGRPKQMAEITMGANIHSSIADLYDMTKLSKKQLQELERILCGTMRTVPEPPIIFPVAAELKPNGNGDELKKSGG